MTARFSRRSLRQLDEIAEYIAAENPRVAGALLIRVEQLANLLGRHPLLGRPTDLDGVRVFRASPYPYLILYRVDPNGQDVTVLRIRHTARRENWREGH
jgi:toxin ParE1/3/4